MDIRHGYYTIILTYGAAVPNRRFWTRCTLFCTSFVTVPHGLDHHANDHGELTDLPTQGALKFIEASF
jgi:hypothetical protein